MFLFLLLSLWQQGRKRMALSSLGAGESTLSDTGSEENRCPVVTTQEVGEQPPHVTGWRKRTLWLLCGGKSQRSPLDAILVTLEGWKHSWQPCAGIAYTFNLSLNGKKNGSNSSSAGIRWYYLNVLPFTWAPFLVLWLHTSRSVLNWTFSYLVLLALPDFQVHHTRCNFTITLIHWVMWSLAGLFSL